MVITATAPAKIILFGEHFVIYGEPSIVTAIDLRAKVLAEFRKDRRVYINSPNLKVAGFFLENRFKAELGGEDARVKLEPVRTIIQRILALSKRNTGLSVKIHSPIPVAAGLGSSAAVAVATAAAIGRLLGLEMSRDDIFRIACDAERFIHRTPSGIDPAISTYGGILLFNKNKGFKALETKGDLKLVVGNTGIERSTGEMVMKVQRKIEHYTSVFNPIIKAGGKITHLAAKALEEEDFYTLGKLMNINHELLSALGVSNDFLDKLVQTARKAGALGSKLTGAGGGGCMVALVTSDKKESVMKAIQKAGGKPFLARKSDIGVETY